MKKKKEILLVALGGNALVGKNQEGTTEEQLENLKIPRKNKLPPFPADTESSSPMENAPTSGEPCCSNRSVAIPSPRLPLEILVAQTQGQIGYMIESDA